MLGASPPVVSVPAASGPPDPSTEVATDVVAPPDAAAAAAATLADASPSPDGSIDVSLAGLLVQPGSSSAVCPVSILEKVSHEGESVGPLGRGRRNSEGVDSSYRL